MEITGSRALRIWGAVHQIRNMPDDDTRKARIEYRCQQIIRDRDGLLDAYAKRDGKGNQTTASKDREKQIRKDFDALIKKTHKAGFESGPGTPDPYTRGSKATKPNIDPESQIALIFQTVEKHLSTRPMQRALAVQTYVRQKGIGSFRYTEGGRTFCNSRIGAYRIHRNLKRRLDDLFADERILRLSSQ